jgi:hypothetical protein
MNRSLFARRYWGNPSLFLFLRLIICLNSAGVLQYLSSARGLRILAIVPTFGRVDVRKPTHQSKETYATLLCEECQRPEHNRERHYKPPHRAVAIVCTLKSTCSRQSRTASPTFKKAACLEDLQVVLHLATPCVLHRM